MKFVFLDVKTIGDDIDLSRFDLFGEVVKYPFPKKLLRNIPQQFYQSELAPPPPELPPPNESPPLEELPLPYLSLLELPSFHKSLW